MKTRSFPASHIICGRIADHHAFFRSASEAVKHCIEKSCCRFDRVNLVGQEDSVTVICAKIIITAVMTAKHLNTVRRATEIAAVRALRSSSPKSRLHNVAVVMSTLIAIALTRENAEFATEKAATTPLPATDSKNRLNRKLRSV